MQRRLLLAILLIFIIVLSGCVSRDYTQSINPDGSSILTQTTNLSGLLRYSGRVSLSQYELTSNLTSSLEDACQRAQQTNLSCTTNNLTITLSRIFENGDFYLLEKTNAFPFIHYHLTVRSIPESAFSDVSQELRQDIPLSNKKVARKIGFDHGSAYQITYNIIMPGSISSAGTHDYNATIQGDKATFELSKVLINSSPLELNSDSFDVLSVLLFLVLLTLLGITYYFIGTYGRRLPFMTTSHEEEELEVEEKKSKRERRRMFT